jgi:TrpR-related protein YerC/YecD
LKKSIKNEKADRLMDAILTLQSREEAYNFFEDLCTINELEAMSQRFEVADMLRKDETYQKISAETGASTATISRVNRALYYGEDGYETILKRMETK